MKVSVVIPSYNRPEILYRVLYSLWRQQASDYEVLVSIDDDAEIYPKSKAVCDEFSAMGLVLTSFYTGQYKRGVTADGNFEMGQGWSLETYPYNVGIRNATGDIIILNSGDVMSVTNTIDQHRHWHENNQRTVLISTVHALTETVQNNIDSYDWKNNPASLLFRGSCYKMFTGMGTSYTNMYAFEDAGAPYHFQMSVPKYALHNIHGFDEDYYGRMMCGDDDLADRLKRGCDLTFNYQSDALAIHQFHKSPELLTEHVSAVSNKDVESGHTLYRQRMSQGVVRNVNHEWGQYPRDMQKLPWMSGVN